jgi:oligosaccharide reducing-end xylanase
VGSDQANIQDILHDREVRTEGIGLAMMIAVELDKRTEFDRLWTYANNVARYMDPARAGYFQSRCDTTMSTTGPCDDPYGMQQMLMALIFAHDRWNSDSGPVNYEAGAVALLDVMRHKEDQNGGIVDGVTNVFDPDSALPFDVPTADAAALHIGRPSIVMPGYYELWAEATGSDPFWSRAAASGRQYWQRAANSTTGLTPVRAVFDGTQLPGSNTFLPESYRAQVSMTLDQIWTGGNDWEVQEANRLLTFFSGQGMAFYGTSYTLDGMPLNTLRDNALVAVNGVTAVIATSGRGPFLDDAWNLQIPVGMARYYDGVLELTALLIMSGQYQVW